MEFPSNWENRFPAWILFFTVALAPLPFGSTDASAEAFWCIVLGVGVITLSPIRLRRAHLRLLLVVAIVVAAYTVLLHEQLALNPWFPSAQPSPLWAQTSELLKIPLEPTVSIARHQPFYALGAPFIALLTVVCAFVVCYDRNRALQLLKVVAWSGVAYAIFGFAFFLIDPTKVLWREKQAYLTFLTSTFINRNTAAVYFGSCAIIWLLFVSENIRNHVVQKRIAWRHVFSRLLLKMPRHVLMPFLMLLVCISAMFMTGSRAGIILSLAALVFTATAHFYRDISGRFGPIIAILIGSALALILLQTLGVGVSDRFNTQGLSDELRFDTYRSTRAIIADHLWFGTGIGTFPWSFPAYRAPEGLMWGTWDRSHNTLLEIISEGGLPLAITICLAWVIALLTLVRGIMIRRRDRIVPIAAFAISAVALMHSAIDFSIQIPGFAITVFAVLGAGLVQSFPSKPLDKSSQWQR